MELSLSVNWPIESSIMATRQLQPQKRISIGQKEGGREREQPKKQTATCLTLS